MRSLSCARASPSGGRVSFVCLLVSGLNKHRPIRRDSAENRRFAVDLLLVRGVPPLTAPRPEHGEKVLIFVRKQFRFGNLADEGPGARG